MQLTKLSYYVSDWELIDLELSQVNLIVAKNGTGKSRTILSLQLLIKIIIQRFDWKRGGKWDAAFLSSNKNIIKYTFQIGSESNGDVEFEELTIDDIQVLVRDGTNTTILNKLTDKQDSLYPPKNKLVLHSNRDIKRYPFLEDLYLWAERSFGFLFANVSPFSSTTQYEFFYSDVKEIPVIYKSLSRDIQERIKKEMNDIGYKITAISAKDEESSVTILYVKENDIEQWLPHYQLSQGMYRAISILIYLEYLIKEKNTVLFTVDDLCEGLDYDRAKKLGELVFEKCLNSNVQLVATSNDSFLMDVIDIKYWNVLHRNGKTVTALNAKNHPKVFADFKFTGLSNFDFFSSDYLNQGLAS